MINSVFPSEPREGLLRALVLAENESGPSPRGVTLSDLAKLVNLSVPVVLRHLELLVRAGVVEKLPVPRSRASLYRAKPFFQGVWVDPHRGLVSSWETADEFNWHLPLVSRVRDEKARRTLLKLLPLAQARGLLKPHDQKAKPSPKGPLPTLLVHGSCARGDARADSDLDIAVRTQQTTKAVRKAWTDFIAEANLWSERPIDLHLLTLEEILRAPPEFQRNLTREAVTVWAPFPSDEFMEGLHFAAILENVRRSDSQSRLVG